MECKKGFTLVELMITVAIVGILASVAYPTYLQSITKSRRADAQATLFGLAQAMERFYTNNGTYEGAADTDNSPTIFSATSPLDSADVYYNLTVESADVSSYRLKADPVNAQEGDGMLTLKSTGEKGWDINDDGTVADTEDCWQKSCN